MQQDQISFRPTRAGNQVPYRYLQRMGNCLPDVRVTSMRLPSLSIDSKTPDDQHRPPDKVAAELPDSDPSVWGSADRNDIRCSQKSAFLLQRAGQSPLPISHPDLEPVPSQREVAHRDDVDDRSHQWYSPLP